MTGMNLQKYILLCSLVYLSVVFFIGCAGSSNEMALKTDPIKQLNREKALEHFINGSMYDQKGDYANAILEYQDALRYDKDPAIFFAISRDYSLLRKHALAAQAAREAISIAPNEIKYRENLGEIYVNAGELDNAITSYNNVLNLDSNNTDAWYRLARLHQFKQPLKALEVYTQMLHRFGPSLEVLMQLSQLYTVLDKTDDAIKMVKSILDIEPGNYEVKKFLAELYLKSDKADSALVLYNDIVEVLPLDVESRASLAHLYLQKQDYKNASLQFDIVMKGEILPIDSQLKFGQIFLGFIQKDSAVTPFALKLFDNIRKQYPDDSRPYLFLGILYSMSKSDSAASTNLHKVTELDRTNKDGWIYLASLYYDKQEFSKVVDVLEEAKKYISNELRLHLLLGISYQRLHELNKAAISLEQAYQLDEKNVDVLSALGLVYDDLKRYEDSDSIYEKALRLYPNNHLLLNNYAYSLSVRNIQLDLALKMAQDAVRQQPKNPSYLDTIGWVYFQLGSYEEAKNYILEAIDAGEVSSIVLEHIGDVYFMLGEKEKSQDYWKQAFDKAPTNKSLQEKINRGTL
jgi:tetratricopeptide (TPR) repeat protein